jgi:hypothetical protein
VGVCGDGLLKRTLQVAPPRPYIQLDRMKGADMKKLILKLALKMLMKRLARRRS